MAAKPRKYLGLITRKPRLVLSERIWQSSYDLYTQITRSRLTPEKVDSHFFDVILKRRESLQSFIHKIWFTNGLLIVVLFLNLRIAKTKLSIFGVELHDISLLKEVIASASITLTLIGIVLTISRNYLASVLKAGIEIKYEPQVRETYLLMYGHHKFNLPLYLYDPVAHITPSEVLNWATSLILTLFGLWFLSVFIATSWIYIEIAIEIVNHPSYGVIWTTIFLSYIGGTWLLTVLLSVIFSDVPVPLISYKRLREIELLRQTDRAAYLQKIDEYME